MMSKYESVREARPGEVSFGPNNLRLTPPLYPAMRTDRHPRQMQQGSADTWQHQQQMQQQQGSQMPQDEAEFADSLGAFA